jgi:hypothetical protein
MLTASTVSIYAGGQLMPPASTDTSPGGLLSQPSAHLSEYLRSERGLTQLLTHSHTHTLSPNPSRRRKQPQPTLPPATAARELRPCAAASAAIGKLSTHSSTSSSSTDVEQVHRRRMAAAPSRRTLANSCLSPC